MNHCHKRMTFIERKRDYRIFKCQVCGIGTIYFDSGSRLDGHLRKK